MAVESGSQEQAFSKVEAGYGTLATPSSTDGIRHSDMQLIPKLNREESPQKRTTPDAAKSLPRRQTGTFSVSGLWEPSGTLGTAGYFASLFKAAFGAQTSPALTTTVAASPSPADDGFTVADATGLTVNDAMVVTLSAGREITRVTSIASEALTVDTLSEAPASAAAAVAGVSYKLASLLTDSLSLFLFHTAGGFAQAGQGCIVNKVEWKFDGTKEVQVSFSGPAKQIVRSGFSQPGSHTTSGNPAGGTVGAFDLDDSSFLVTDATVTLDNSVELRNRDLGTATATGFFRTNKRKITAGCSFYLEDVTIFTNAEGVVRNILRLLVGDTNGSMVGVVLPSVEWEIPEVPTTTGPKIVQANGMGYAVSGNDGLVAMES